LSLRETTRLIVKLVEEHSGYPVQIIDDPSLNTLASIRLARRGSVSAHILAYRPVGNQAPDYLIAFQCGFALRLFAVPPELRLGTGINQASLVVEGCRIQAIASKSAQLRKGCRVFCGTAFGPARPGVNRAL
jgi:hypothetical protein